MIYFDGSEVNVANGPAWYWISQQQMSNWRLVKRDILVQGSGLTPWTWHIFSRGTCNDFAVVASKQYLDYHKIADYWHAYKNNFFPTKLGWLGFLTATPDHPATKPDEVEYYAIRMLALDSPVSLETTLQDLKENGRTDEMHSLLGECEKMRLKRSVLLAIREKLLTGEWHMILKGGKVGFHPVRYDEKWLNEMGEIKIHTPYASQKFKSRLQVMPTLVIEGDRANILLFSPAIPLLLQSPAPKAAMPDALAKRIEFTRPEGEDVSAFKVSSGGESGPNQRGKTLDLTIHRALAFRLKLDGPPPKPGESYAVLNVQLEDGGRKYRDHFIDLNFTGEQTIIIPEPNTERMLPEFRPSPENYPLKSAMYTFDYKNIN